MCVCVSTSARCTLSHSIRVSSLWTSQLSGDFPSFSYRPKLGRGRWRKPHTHFCKQRWQKAATLGSFPGMNNKRNADHSSCKMGCNSCLDSITASPNLTFVMKRFYYRNSLLAASARSHLVWPPYRPRLLHNPHCFNPLRFAGKVHRRREFGREA